VETLALPGAQGLAVVQAPREGLASQAWRGLRASLGSLVMPGSQAWPVKLALPGWRGLQVLPGSQVSRGMRELLASQGWLELQVSRELLA
jgi:hypothetical protein